MVFCFLDTRFLESNKDCVAMVVPSVVVSLEIDKEDLTHFVYRSVAVTFAVLTYTETCHTAAYMELEVLAFEVG